MTLNSLKCEHRSGRTNSPADYSYGPRARLRSATDRGSSNGSGAINLLHLIQIESLILNAFSFGEENSFVNSCYVRTRNFSNITILVIQREREREREREKES